MHSNEELTKIYTGGSTEELNIYTGGGLLEIHTLPNIVVNYHSIHIKSGDDHLLTYLIVTIINGYNI